METFLMMLVAEAALNKCARYLDLACGVPVEHVAAVEAQADWYVNRASEVYAHMGYRLDKGTGAVELA